MYPAQLWKRLPDGKVQCQLCAHYCRLDTDERGRCGVRQCRDGALFTLVHDRVAAINLDPVEKKPLYHFLPGTTTLSFGTMGCNLSCAFCQNYTLSQPPRQGRPIAGEHVTPQELVRAATRSGAASISYTYSEPTIFFELMTETASLAHAKGLKNIWFPTDSRARSASRPWGRSSTRPISTSRPWTRIFTSGSAGPSWRRCWPTLFTCGVWAGGSR
jgi:pyruvate formate lyase activating enzyme